VVDVPEEADPNTYRRPASFSRDPNKYVMIPANARRRHPLIEQRLRTWPSLVKISLQQDGDSDRSLGIVTSGVAYQYAREAFPKLHS